jgi:hypothetical protein
VLGEGNSVPIDLDIRRRAIVRAFRSSARPDAITEVQRALVTLTQRVDELAREVDALRRRGNEHLPSAPALEEEPPNGRVSVPPITAATISTQAFDVLLGTAAGEVEARSRIA